MLKCFPTICWQQQVNSYTENTEDYTKYFEATVSLTLLITNSTVLCIFKNIN